MTTLLSKVQHNTFEIGEFVVEKERDYNETIRLIEIFPWEDERKNIVISLTNPSITIEDKNNDFLKLALFYNGKFVLHYFNQNQALFTKSFTNIKDSYQYVKNFFDEDNFDTSDFKKENVMLQHNLQHFISQDFHYIASTDVIRKFLISTTGFNLSASIFMIGLFIFTRGHKELPVLVFLLIFIIIAGGGLNLILFFNFYSHVKNKILIMSKGNDIFYYGDIDNPKEYNKSQIIRFRTIKIRASRNPLSGFAVIAIELKDGSELQIPNLLVDYLAMQQKLSGIQGIQENRTPFIKN